MAEVPDWTKRFAAILLPVLAVLIVLAFVLANHKGKGTRRTPPPAVRK